MKECYILLKVLFSFFYIYRVNFNFYVFVFAAVMRSFSSLQEHVIPFLGELLPKLTEKLSFVARNPSRPHFNHYLFETLSISIR